MTKPLGRKSYGSIGHLPNSRLGPGDHCVTEGQARIATTKTRDRHDVIIVQEKLDGSNVGVCKIDGEVIALIRAGYRASTSPYLMHQLFDAWVRKNVSRFESVLEDGDRLCGEWLLQAHGTRYDLAHEPFVVFDLMREATRFPYEEFKSRVSSSFIIPHELHFGNAPYSVDSAMHQLLNGGFHGSTDSVEGAMWRVESRGKVDFLCKYVRPDKVDGQFLPGCRGNPKDASPIWNVDIDNFKSNLKF